MKLSIIIPVYNVQDYIATCLESIFNQNLRPEDYEVIVINDGSTDNSKIIIQQYENIKNIIFIDQENQGVSGARNRGLDIAKGTYVAFIDPDDSIYPNCLASILSVLDRDDLDMLYLNLDAFDEAGNFLLRTDSTGSDGNIVSGFEHPRRAYISTFYKLKTIADIRFKPGIIRGQDTVFTLMVQAKSAKCSYSSIPYYKYLQRKSSTRQFVGTEKNFISILLAIDTINKFRIENYPNQTSIQKSYFDDAIVVFIQRALDWIILPQSNKSTFTRLKGALASMNLHYLINRTAKKQPMFDMPFEVFMGYRKLSGYYDAIIYKLKKKW